MSVIEFEIKDPKKQRDFYKELCDTKESEINKLQHQLEEKDKIINEARKFLKEFHNYENRFKWCEEDYIKTILELEKILERGKNGK